jgi:hypothetical protein
VPDGDVSDRQRKLEEEFRARYDDQAAIDTEIADVTASLIAEGILHEGASGLSLSAVAEVLKCHASHGLLPLSEAEPVLTRAAARAWFEP